MRQTDSNPRSRATSGSAGRGSRSLSRSSTGLFASGSLLAAEADLEVFTDEVKVGMQQRKVGVWPTWDRREAFAKRKIYGWVREHIRNKSDVKSIKNVVEVAPSKPAFETNQFHWAIVACLEARVPIDRRYASKYGRELLHAHKHEVEPEQLIGFIYQCGGYEAINLKLKQGILEDWYTPAYRKRMSRSLER